jgi:hypothetical protein
MKNSIRLLLATAALLLSSFTPHCLAASQVTMDLTGQVLRSGGTVKVSSTIPLDHSSVYFYSFSGVVSGTGAGNAFAAVTGTGVSLLSAIELTDSNLVPYLAGTVLDAGAKFPFTAVNKTEKGTYIFTSGPLAGGTLTGTAHEEAGISKKGLAFGEINSISFKVKVPHFGNISLPKTDSLTFLSGQVLIQTTPILGSAFQPDLAFVTGTGLAGIGITGTDNVGLGGSETQEFGIAKKNSRTLALALENSGTSADIYTLTATPADSGFTQEFIYKGKNITAAVTGTTGGFTLPQPTHKTTVELDSGAVATLTWKITNKSAQTAASIGPVLTVTSTGDTAKQDAVEFLVIGE